MNPIIEYDHYFCIHLVPYKTPDVIPEAFELQTYEYSRSAKLYWKVSLKIVLKVKRFLKDHSLFFFTLFSKFIS